jgi:hypothetical protein
MRGDDKPAVIKRQRQIISVAGATQTGQKAISFRAELQRAVLSGGLQLRFGRLAAKLPL